MWNDTPSPRPGHLFAAVKWSASSVPLFLVLALSHRTLQSKRLLPVNAAGDHTHVFTSFLVVNEPLGMKQFLIHTLIINNYVNNTRKRSMWASQGLDISFGCFTGGPLLDAAQKLVIDSADIWSASRIHCLYPSHQRRSWRGTACFYAPVVLQGNNKKAERRTLIYIS